MKNKKYESISKAKIVVGLGYGDEGKGLTVDWLCEKYANPVVIRFSGGQQAGHTVHKNGVKHTFSNFGSGTLQKVPTYFSEHTTFYPIGIQREAKVLKELGYSDPKLVIHPMSRITTPWDVFENRVCVTTLANGSCGQGVGKTMKRNEGTYQLRAIDLYNKDIFSAKLAQIEKDYYRRGFKISTELSKEISEFNLAVKEMVMRVQDYTYLKKFTTLIFEGSQGIMLDKDHGIFPNVTYANTTSKNAMEICDKLKIDSRHIYCVTRAYSTRHGKGDGEYEGVPITLFNTEHEINVNNKYQGEFLCTKIDYKRLSYAILVESIYSGRHKHSLMVTCNNQISAPDEFDPGLIPIITDFQDIYYSFSPEGNFIRNRNLII